MLHTGGNTVPRFTLASISASNASDGGVFKHVTCNVTGRAFAKMATGDAGSDVASCEPTLEGATRERPDLAAVLSCSFPPRLAKKACFAGLTAQSGDYFMLSPELAVLALGGLAVSAQSTTLQPGTFLLVEPLIAASINRNTRDDGRTEWHPSDKPLALLDVTALSRVHQVSFVRESRNADGQLVVSLLHWWHWRVLRIERVLLHVTGFTASSG